MKNYRFPLRYHLCRALYTILLLCALPLLLVLIRKKLFMSKPSTSGRRFRERLGIVPKSYSQNGIVIHCVSMGEVNAAKQLIERLLQSHPDISITVTTSSHTGAEHSQNIFKDRVQHLFLPFDLPWCVSFFLNALKPRLLLITEVEIWPNLMHACKSKGIYTALINARMSRNSLVQYKKISWLFRYTLRSFQRICPQSYESFNHFLEYGVYKSAVSLTGNMKFDLEEDQNDLALAKEISSRFSLSERVVWVMGSTHEPEEKLGIKHFLAIKERFPHLCLVIVPRHPHRFDQVFQLLKASGLSLARASDESAQSKTVDCVLIDKMGWLKACYALSDIVFVGGSFSDRGGHNPLEVALYSKPMAMGPSIFNNPELCDALADSGALKICENEEELSTFLDHVLSYPDKAESMGQSCEDVLKANQGAVTNTYEVVQNLLERT